MSKDFYSNVEFNNNVNVYGTLTASTNTSYMGDIVSAAGGGGGGGGFYIWSASTEYKNIYILSASSAGEAVTGTSIGWAQYMDLTASGGNYSLYAYDNSGVGTDTLWIDRLTGVAGFNYGFLVQSGAAGPGTNYGGTTTASISQSGNMYLAGNLTASVGTTTLGTATITNANLTSASVNGQSLTPAQVSANLYLAYNFI